MKICLFKTKNGWIIHDEAYISTGDVEHLLVFETMRGVCSHLQKIETPNALPKRLPNGRFIPKATHLIPEAKSRLQLHSSQK